MNKIDPDRIIATLANIEHVGTTPEISMRLFQLVKDSNVAIEKIADLILKDPTITAQLLKLSNSVYYSRGNTIRTVTEAIVVLGLTTVKRLVMAIEMIGLFHNSSSRVEFDFKAFYKSSLAGAMLCNRIAIKLGFEDTETPFICGLLRDYGVLVIRQYFPDLFLEVNAMLNEKRISFAEAVKIAGMPDHRFVAYLLFIHWCMPPRILNTFEDPSPKLFNYVDGLLKNCGYGQWEKYSNPAAVQSDKLILDKVFLNEITAAVCKEVDELVAALMI